MTRLIVADENIVAARECFGQLGEVRLVNGRQLTADQVRDADALMVRSVTRVNAQLLQGSAVRFVGSTTIGTDHLDIPWLQARGIRWCNAPGSNANSVVDYCFSAFCRIDGLLERLFQGATVGIVGFGNVGSRLYRRLHALGVRCLAYDPFLSAAQCPVLASLDEVLGCDVLSLHTPLTVSGPFPTRHMLSLAHLGHLPANAVVLNAGRGEVLSTEVLLELSQRRPDIRLVLDVWESEPTIDIALPERCALATPHIAGYSADGKIAGLRQVAAEYAAYLGEPLRDFALPPGLAQPPTLQLDPALRETDLIRAAVLGCYDVADDDRRLREALGSKDEIARARAFDRLRKDYPQRREMCSFSVHGTDGMDDRQRQWLRRLGFEDVRS